jgi:hypothetical protein
MAAERSEQVAALPRRVLYISAVDMTTQFAGHEIVSLPFERLDAASLAAAAPELVIFPLFAGMLDAAQILTALAELGYRGDCLVMAPPLPKPQMIEHELRGLCPGVSLRLVSSDAALQAAGLSRR